METVKIKITHSGEIIEYPLPELKVILLRDGSIQMRECKETYDFEGQKKAIANYFVVDAVQSEADAHHDDIGWQQLYFIQYTDGEYHLVINNMDWTSRDVGEILKHCIEYNYPKIREVHPMFSNLQRSMSKLSPFKERLEDVTAHLTSPEDSYEQIIMLHLENRFDDAADITNIMIALSRVQTTMAKELQNLLEK